MEIHSSSLAYVPNGQNANNKTDDSLRTDTSKDSQQNQATPALPPPEPTPKSFNPNNFEQLSDEINKQQNSSTNKRTANALNAYAQQETQALKSQRSGLISGIDLFV